MIPPARSSQLALGLGATVRAMVAPWTFDRRPDRVRWPMAAFLAAVNIGVAAVLSTVLSTWTYLVGKGLLVTPKEMDMGADDLPADTIRQVAEGWIGSFSMWIVLLVLIVLVCIASADALYRSDRASFRIAAIRTCLMTGWLVVWAAAVFAANSVRQQEIRHPAGAVRAYAQLNQHWFRGSSAWDPGRIEREPLIGRGRLWPLVVVFPIIWSVALPRRTVPRGRTPLLIGAAILLSWLGFWLAWRLLPWVWIEAVVG